MWQDLLLLEKKSMLKYHFHPDQDSTQLVTQDTLLGTPESL